MANISYKDAGVDIDAGNAFVEAIKADVKSTFDSNVIGGIGIGPVAPESDGDRLGQAGVPNGAAAQQYQQGQQQYLAQFPLHGDPFCSFASSIWEIVHGCSGAAAVFLMSNHISLLGHRKGCCITNRSFKEGVV